MSRQETKPCDICRTRFLVSGPWEYLRDRDYCKPCNRAYKWYMRVRKEPLDTDSVYHELAHHVLLFRRLPKTEKDLREIEQAIGKFSSRDSQLHEIRTLALQYATYKQLEWKVSMAGLIDPSWAGIREAEDDYGRDRQVIKSETQAARVLREMIPEVSPRNIRLLKTALAIARA